MQTYDSGLGYSIVSGYGVRKELGGLCRAMFGQSEAYILADSNVGRLWLPEYENELHRNGIRTHSFVFEAGEDRKNIDTVTAFLKFMLKNHISRQDYVIGLGGGVTGDLAGFAASLCLRGIKYVQVPTTLLSAIDSSIGGKTGIDFGGVKNSVGSFFNPSLSVFDFDTLSTLPEKELHNGAAEMIKYGVISDSGIFEPVSCGLSRETLTEDLVAKCVKIKTDTVAADPFDKGIRKLLNFGHTFGHAYEVLSGYDISHGEAVAAGMVTAAKISHAMNFCNAEIPEIISKACLANKLPSEFNFSKEAVINAIRQDKKHFAETIDFVFVRSIGTCKILNTEISTLADLM